MAQDNKIAPVVILESFRDLLARAERVSGTEAKCGL